MVDESAIQRFVGRLNALRMLAERATREKAGDARALYAAAGLFRQAGDLHGALGALEAAITLDANQPAFWFERGQTLRFLGRLDDAARAYERALEADPDAYRARHALVQLRPQTRADLTALAELMEGPDEQGWRTLHIGHAAAKACEDIGDLAKSFEWLARAKARRASLCAYDVAAEEAFATAALSCGAPPPTESSPAGPILIMGLPRSGTTLTDRIVSSHPDVHSAGELANFPVLFNLMAGAQAPNSRSLESLASRSVDYERLGRLYIESTRPRAGASARFTDKAPGNYLFAAHIARALPGARLICLRRHPLDSVLSNYRQVFATEDRYYDYAYGLEAAAHKVVQFHRVAAHWRALLPNDIYCELDYDALVADQERATRRLLTFCGLTWDAKCLAPHENTQGAATPSAAQVRAPLNAASSGRWRRYGALLDPARRVLERAGLM